MKKRSVYFLFILALGLIMTVVQCSHADQLERFGKTSSNGEDESHNFMQNCMTCHNDDSNEASRIGGGWWTIAGSAYASDGASPAQSGTIELWSEPNRSGTRYVSLPLDDLGNFYTEKIVDFNGIAYPVIVNDSGNFLSMSEPFTGGGCNGCHNNEVAAQLVMP